MVVSVCGARAVVRGVGARARQRLGGDGGFHDGGASERAAFFDIDRGTVSTLMSPIAYHLESMVLFSKKGVWRHRNGAGANVTFADGHVEGMTRNEIPTTNGKNAGYFWYSGDKTKADGYY